MSTCYIGDTIQDEPGVECALVQYCNGGFFFWHWNSASRKRRRIVLWRNNDSQSQSQRALIWLNRKKSISEMIHRNMTMPVKSRTSWLTCSWAIWNISSKQSEIVPSIFLYFNHRESTEFTHVFDTTASLDHSNDTILAPHFTKSGHIAQTNKVQNSCC